MNPFSNLPQQIRNAANNVYNDFATIFGGNKSNQSNLTNNRRASNVQQRPAQGQNVENERVKSWNVSYGHSPSEKLRMYEGAFGRYEDLAATAGVPSNVSLDDKLKWYKKEFGTLTRRGRSDSYETYIDFKASDNYNNRRQYRQPGDDRVPLPGEVQGSTAQTPQQAIAEARNYIDYNYDKFRTIFDAIATQEGIDLTAYAQGYEASIRDIDNELNYLTSDRNRQKQLNERDFNQVIERAQRNTTQDLADNYENYTRVAGELGISFDEARGALRTNLAEGSQGVREQAAAENQNIQSYLASSGLADSSLAQVAQRLQQRQLGNTLQRAEGDYTDNLQRTTDQFNRQSENLRTDFERTQGRLRQGLQDFVGDTTQRFNDAKSANERSYQEALNQAQRDKSFQEYQLREQQRQAYYNSTQQRLQQIDQYADFLYNQYINSGYTPNQAIAKKQEWERSQNRSYYQDILYGNKRHPEYGGLVNQPEVYNPGKIIPAGEQTISSPSQLVSDSGQTNQPVFAVYEPAETNQSLARPIERVDKINTQAGTISRFARPQVGDKEYETFAMPLRSDRNEAKSKARYANAGKDYKLSSY